MLMLALDLQLRGSAAGALGTLGPPGGPKDPSGPLGGPGGPWKRSFSFLLEVNLSMVLANIDVFSFE